MRILDEVDEPICFYEKDDIVYEGLGLIDYAFIPHYKAFYYHKVDLIDKVVQKCQNENIKYKAVKDGEVIIEMIARTKAKDNRY